MISFEDELTALEDDFFGFLFYDLLDYFVLWFIIVYVI
jgi:hypothetical protein